MLSRRRILGWTLILGGAMLPAFARAEAPSASYIFPAGGQRGTTVPVRVGGHYLHEECPWVMLGPGVTASPMLTRAEKTVWFEGPVIPLPDSQRAEDYPQDQIGTVQIAADAVTGVRRWQVWTAQGATPSLKFIVGNLPELIEQEIEGDPVPVPVTLPVTINGRSFPREDVDVWTVQATAGQTITCDVQALRIGSPLVARLEILDPHGRRIAEEVATAAEEARLRFTAAEDGTYQVRIHDVNFEGLQNYVYRLTLTAGPFVDRIFPLGGRRGTTGRFQLSGQGVPAEPIELAVPNSPAATAWLDLPGEIRAAHPFLLELDDLPETIEAAAPPSDPIATPAILNGRITQPGEVDLWTITGKPGSTCDLDLRAARLGSPLDSLVVVTDAKGVERGRADDIGADTTDSKLTATFPDDGLLLVRVQERSPRRGGPEFAYRLRISPPPSPGFRLRFAADTALLPRPGAAKLKVFIEKLGGFNQEIQLTIDGLPDGVTAEGTKADAGANEIQISLNATAAARIGGARLSVRGKARIGEADVVQQAVLASEPGEMPLDSVLLAVTLPTPFKFRGVFETKYAPRGAEFTRQYQIERNGFEGPLEIQLADRQFRHLQGVTGPKIVVPAGVNEFTYPIYLPPWMEIGRTSRTILSATGLVEEPNGEKHKVSYASGEPADQIIILVDPGQLTVESTVRSLRANPGVTVAVPFDVGRGQGLDGKPVRVELVVPAHVQGVTAEPFDLPSDRTHGEVSLQFAPGAGPFNAPLILRAVTTLEGRRIVAERKLEVVPE